MFDSQAIQKAQQSMAPLLNMITANGQGDAQQATPNLPMATDSSNVQQQAPSYFRSLESLLHANSPAADQIVRGSSGGYSTGGANRGSAREGDTNAKVQDLAVGLGLFSPRMYMKGRDGDSGGQGQGQDQRGQSSMAAAQAVNLVQILQAQGLLAQQQSGLQGYLTPLRKDGVDFQGTTPPELANTFNELMKELGNRLASELNDTASSSSAPSQNPVEMLSKVPNALTAETPDTKTVVQRLEDAISYHLLMANQAMEQENQSNGVVEAAGLVLKTLVGKLQNGEIEPTPSVMETIVQALEGIIALNPELINSGVGQRLQTMRGMLAAMKNQGANEAKSGDQSMNNSSSLENSGWQTQPESEPVSQNATPLQQPKNFDAVASGTMDSSGVLKGVGFEGGNNDEFQYQLQPDNQGKVNIVSGMGEGQGGFNLVGRMNLDDAGNPTGLTESSIHWNGGKEAIRMSGSGTGEFSNNGGESWMPLPNGQSSRYVSPDKRYSVQFNPVERSVNFQESEGGKRLGSANLHADGENINISDISLKIAAQVG